MSLLVENIRAQVAETVKDQVAEMRAEMRAMAGQIHGKLVADLREALAAEMRAMRDEIQNTPAGPKEARTSYSVEEVAKNIGKSEFTVRQWCNLGRINAVKSSERRGGVALWRISASEIHRYREEGLLPMDPSRNAAR